MRRFMLNPPVSQRCNAGSGLAMTEKPSITNFTPTSGKAGTNVTITGRNLTHATAVEIGGVAAMFKVASATKVIVTVPKKWKTGKIKMDTSLPHVPTYHVRA